MGRTVQEVLQGRGSKKRKGLWINRVLPLFLLFVTYLGLLFDIPSNRKDIWFLVSITSIVVLFGLHIIKKGKEFSLEFLSSIALFITGSVHAFGTPWLKIAYFPFIISLPAFYGTKTVISLLLIVPFFEISEFIHGIQKEKLLNEAIFMVFLIVSTCISIFLRSKIKKGLLEPGIKNFDNDAAEALNPLLHMKGEGSPMGVTGEASDEIISLSDEKIIPQYFELMFKPDDDIKELLLVIKNTLLADSVSFFVSYGETLRLRCSTEEAEKIIPSTGGIIDLCLKERRSFLYTDLIERKQEAGYLKKDKISSLIAVPVVDGSFTLGVMTADSARFHAFASADKDLMEMFSNQIVKIIKRERVYPQIYRSFTNLKILHDESSKLLSSLNMDIIIKYLTEGAQKIVPSEVIFFVVKGREVEIFFETGSRSTEHKSFSIKGTLLDMVIKNRDPLYISDIKTYRSPVLPFKTNEIGSVLILPLKYEKNLLGILALLIEKTNALTPHQRELLEVLGNQASTSIANAMFHAEIERLSVTDGLTGLFNHRHFQERLSQEFRRFERFSEPISLLIIDIDHFKKVNDTYGHPVGDNVLKKVADIIRKTIRNIDIPARYGGEEFAVILLGTDAEGAMRMAERLRKEIIHTKFEAEKQAFQVTVSIGISTYTDGIRKKEELVERADKALYHAKRSGRNCCIRWSEASNESSSNR